MRFSKSKTRSDRSGRQHCCAAVARRPLRWRNRRLGAAKGTGAKRSPRILGNRHESCSLQPARGRESGGADPPPERLLSLAALQRWVPPFGKRGCETPCKLRLRGCTPSREGPAQRRGILDFTITS